MSKKVFTGINREEIIEQVSSWLEENIQEYESVGIVVEIIKDKSFN